MLACSFAVLRPQRYGLVGGGCPPSQALRRPIWPRTCLPAGHNFCKPCLEKKFGHIADEIDAGAATGRSLRVRKVVKPCPTCKASVLFPVSLRTRHVLVVYTHCLRAQGGQRKVVKPCSTCNVRGAYHLGLMVQQGAESQKMTHVFLCRPTSAIS